MSGEVRALKCPCLHSWPHCQIQSSFLITSLASVKPPGHAWLWAVLTVNPSRGQAGGWGGGVPVGGEDGVFSPFQSNKKALRMAGDACYHIRFLCFHWKWNFGWNELDQKKRRWIGKLMINATWLFLECLVLFRVFPPELFFRPSEHLKSS